MIVYDTSAFLNRFFFDDLKEGYITNSVIAEIKDFEHKQIIENNIARGKLKIKDPKDSCLKKILQITKRSKLSDTDKEVLALAYELKAELITDDAELMDYAIKIGLVARRILFSREYDWKKIQKVFEKEFEKIKPTEKELREIKHTEELVLRQLEKANDFLKLPIKKMLLAGSASRATFIHNKKDLDFFVLFDLKVEEQKLEQYLEDLLKKAFVGLKLERRYSQHPYFRAKLFGFEVDFVPGYAIKNIKEKKSAVDRTPLHLAYLQKHLKEEQKKEVILLKKFLKNNLLYGGDLKYKGMPGYLTELLILNYGSLQNLFFAITKWKSKVFIDLENHFSGKQFTENLVVIDPTDPERNVAAAFSARNYEILKFLVKEFMQNPSLKFFEKNIYREYVSLPENLFIFETNTPEHKNLDALYGTLSAKLEKAKNLAKQKFVFVNRKSVIFEKKPYFVFEVKTEDHIHKGPFAKDKNNVLEFKKKYSNVYEENGRYFTVIKYDEKYAENVFLEVFKKMGLKAKRIKHKSVKISRENKKILCKDFLELVK